MEPHATSSQVEAPPSAILVVGGDERSREELAGALTDGGCVAGRSAHAEAALCELEGDSKWDAVLLDLDPLAEGIADVIARFAAEQPGVAALVLTDDPSLPSALAAFRAGAGEYLARPIGDASALLPRIEAAVARHRREQGGGAAAEADRKTLQRQNSVLSRKLDAALRNLREQVHLQQRSREVFYTDLSRVMAIFDNLADGIVFTDIDGKVILINPSAGEMLDVPPFTAMGKPLSLVTGHRGLLKVLTEQREGRIPSEGLNADAPPDAKTAGDACFTVCTTEVHDYQGKLCGVLSLMRDVSLQKKTEQLKNRFLSIVAHELRTPLTIIKAFGTILAQGIHGELPEQCVPLVKHILSQSDRLGHEIDKIISLGRLEAADMAPDLEVVTAQRILEGVASPFEQTAQKKGVRIGIEDRSGGFGVLADLRDLQRAIRALLENSLKFTPEGGSIELRVHPAGENMVFEVEDTGIGIDPENHQTIFERFVQLENPLTRKYGGSGLGLCFAAEIIEAHRSRIEVESEQGKGATFRFRLPTVESALSVGVLPVEERAAPREDGEDLS